MDQFLALLRRPFVRNVLTVASGTAMAQVVTMLFSPLITRLYGPEVLGLQGVFTSIVGLISIVAAMGYPTAIVLPKSDEDSICLVRLSVRIALGTSVVVTIALIQFGSELLRLLNAEAIADFIYLIPIAMLINTLSNILGYWIIRKRAFKISAQCNIFSTLLGSSAKAAFGVFYPNALGLIIINSVSGMLGAALTYIGWRHQTTNLISGSNTSKVVDPSKKNERRKLLEIARAYSDFPLLRAPQNLINAFSQSIPILILASSFGPSAAGQYTIAIAVLGIPATLIGGSVNSVFFPKINEAIQNQENPRNLIVKATVGLVAMGALPFAIVLIAGPILFEMVFGLGWRGAGVYGQWLSLWIFLQFINTPAVSAIPSLNLQGGLLIYELFSTAIKIIALWIGFVYFKNDIAAIAMFSILGSLAYAWLIFWVIKRCSQVGGICTK